MDNIAINLGSVTHYVAHEFATIQCFYFWVLSSIIDSILLVFFLCVCVCMYVGKNVFTHGSLKPEVGIRNLPWPFFYLIL